MFGHKDWNHLRNQGKSNAEIIDALWSNQNLLHAKNRPGMDRAQQGGTHGLFNQIQEAAQRDAKPWNKASGVNDWNYGIWGRQGFGKKDIDAARGAGASEYQLRQLYERANQLGINTAGRHAQEIANTAPKSDWDYGAYGSWGFGMADVEAMDGDLDQIRGARDWARQNRLNIGGGVTEHIAGLEEDRRFEAQQAYNAELLQQQQQQAAEQIRIQEEMAAQAARVKGNSPTGVGGNAAFRGSRLSITEAGGRGGTRRFSRPGTQFMNTLNSGNTAGTTTKSTLNL
jgi:hypothetical protein